LDRAKQLISNFHDFVNDNNSLNDICLNKAENVINKLKENNLHSFNILICLGFSPNENRLNDAVKALLDPNELHQMGILPLKCFLEQLGKLGNIKAKTILEILRQIGRASCRERV
jgi:hypothetical protein